ncbi:MAG: T9SS type A sorting domain-containing protein [Candidatus Hatepunaea meridiana]|nr:T9SS type A sorting domain-containing protein [Candidatus Hatepunaea meridiana]
MLRTNYVLTFTVTMLFGFMAMNAEGATYVFGENGDIQDLTYYGSTWNSSNTYIIAGQCYVEHDDILTISEGVHVIFDYDYDVDVDIAEIEIRGSIFVNGTSDDMVWFTSDDEFDRDYNGIKLNGSESGYEGKLNANYTVFEYGGSSSIDRGLITVDSGGDLNLYQCVVRFSYNDGIFIKGQGSNSNLQNCLIDSSEGNGVGFSEDDENNNASLFISEGLISGNGLDGVCLSAIPREGGGIQPPPAVIIEKITIQRNDRNGIGAPGQYIERWRINARISNCYILRNGHNGILTSPFNSGWLMIHNNSIYRNGIGRGVVEKSGILIQNIGYRENNDPQGLPFEVDIKFNNIRQNKLYGLEIKHWVAGAEWQENLDLQLNVFEKNNMFGPPYYGIKTDYLGAPPPVPVNNAFRDAICINANNENCIIHNGNDITITFQSEDDNDYYLPDWSHFKYDGNNSVINVDDNIIDVDGSPADCGFYGGPRGNSNNRFGCFYVPGDGFRGDPDPYYVALDDDDLDIDEAVLPWARYYYFDDFTIPENSVYTIDAGAELVAKDDYIRFYVDGEIQANGESDNRIRFYNGVDERDNDDPYLWKGVKLCSCSSLNSSFNYVNIGGTYGSYPGLYIYEVDEDPSNDFVIIDHVCIIECKYGIQITSSDVEISDCQFDLNRHSGMKVYNCTAGELWIFDCTFNYNQYEGSTSAGFRLSNCSPYIYGCSIKFNERYAIYSYYSTPWFDMIAVDDNDYDAIKLSESYPDVISNDFIRWSDNFAVDLDSNNDIWYAENNYWGTARPDLIEEQLFSDTDKIVYNPWDDTPNTDDNDDSDYSAGIRLMMSGEHSEAIQYFTRAVFNRDAGGRRCSALRHLRSCYVEADFDFEDLQDFYIEAQEHIRNENLINEAEVQSIWCLGEMGHNQDVLDAFIRLRRNRFENAVDSLRNEVNILLARIMLDDEYELDVLNNNKTNDEAIDDLLELIDMESVKLEKNINPLPSELILYPAYPNPFNSSTVVSFYQPTSGFTNLSLYNINGQFVRFIQVDNAKIGINNVVISADDLPQGIYILNLEANGLQVSEKILLLK